LPQQVIARSDSDKAISKRDCHALWARNDIFFVVPNVTYLMLSVIKEISFLNKLDEEGHGIPFLRRYLREGTQVVSIRKNLTEFSEII
jgi:hypothetical protein